ncbi:MAG: hypothetical protein J5716_00295 [Alphaproteobacteria bacterium]|nr:hypothetical protein [Alphaproteobacteria bacterium]
MRKFFVKVSILCFFFVLLPFEQSYAQQKDVKQLPTCLDFTDVYSKTVLQTSPATKEDDQEMQSLASIMMGYVSALQDIYGNRLVGMSARDNEWTLLDKVAQYCHQYPQMSFQRAVRSIPAVSQTIQALQDEEFKRCNNYIEQMKVAICSTQNQNR